MNWNLPCKECGCQEFITQPNSYDIYEVEAGKLTFQKTEFVDEEFCLYCRDCSEELEFDNQLVNTEE